VWWLGEAWERYNEFEEYRFYDKSLSLAQFIGQWEARLAAAVAAGCEYNDTVLAFKGLWHKIGFMFFKNKDYKIRSRTGNENLSRHWIFIIPNPVLSFKGLWHKIGLIFKKQRL
jgi:hypothetical protein